ncbi:hypothetical protein LL912_00670 [Niabella sp. CC-SYL272]|uniref:hypothetical protein n=1 Tax=Niabella agricola TaxID=2891571 RepID=UPI001F1FC5ED|nr:hypothetical protein [Niabella agricola]MCF3107279.1 hypothetical protein [Niabella agricola]
MENQIVQNSKNEVASIDEFRQRLQNFANVLNLSDPKEGVAKTPDGKAKTLPISFVEMQLDEMFTGLWSTENFKWSVIANEVVGSIDLILIHPVTGREYKRTGAAAIQIMVNKGANPLDINAKKGNALDMGFPKLKAECVKNAAISLGKIFGRDLNRTAADNFNPFYKQTVN